MLTAVVSYMGGKFLDKVFDDSADYLIDKYTKERIKKEYEKLRQLIFDKLIKENINESYFENLQTLIENTDIIKFLFNLCYITNISISESESCIDKYIDNYYADKKISTYDLSIIKGKIRKEYEYCFSIMNKPSDESRKLINQLVVQILNANESQTDLIKSLKCNVNDLNKEIQNVKKLFPVNDVDFDYLKSLVKIAIDNLNVRFNKEFNVDVELSTWLNMFCITEGEKRNLYSDLKELLGATIHVDENTTIKEKIHSLMNNLLENNGLDPSLLEKEMEEFINQSELKNKEKYGETDKAYYESNEYYYWRQLCIKNSNLDNHRKALNADTLLITGEAGIGKTHSITDFVYNIFYLQNKPCIFILGQHLNENFDPIQMLEKNLHLPYTLQRFLEELNTIAEEKNSIVPFIIEGINEGYHSEIWKEYFDGLLGTFENYRSVKLIISIRNTYIKKCLPDKYLERNKTLIIEHMGFADDPTEAVAAFFDYYEIDKPTFPVLYSDFYNPLFLHTLCKIIKVSGHVNVEDYGSLTEIFKGYISVIETKIAEKCRYQVGLKLVKKSVDKIIEYSLDKGVRYGILIDEFYGIISEVIIKYGVPLMDFIQSMIDNGLLYSEIYNEEEYVQFAYERYHNILAAQYLLSSLNSVDELKDSIAEGDLSKHFENGHSGITEELFIIIPDQYKIELLDLFEESKAVDLLEPFLNSLIWRKKSEISLETTIDIINKYIVVRQWYFKRFIKKLFVIAPIEEHPLNALFLHNYLINQTMPIRDSFWVESIYEDTVYENGILNTLIKLCNKQVDTYSNETKELISLLLVWSLASTNNTYRENAIRSLVVLFQNDLNIATATINKFKQVDDGYVKEGLYCAVYGAVLRSQNMNGAKKLGEEVFSDIFEGEVAFQHIIVRSHAKGILDYLILVDIELTFDLNKIVPPYNSKWFEEIPSQEEISMYLVDYKDEKVKPYMYSVNTIIHSMATNTGEKAMMYGDFGRYVFEGWVEPWEYHFIPQELSNIATKQIFETYGYDCELHGEFDEKVKSYDRHNHRNERIGKKYQRIASFELLARLADNFEPGVVKTIYSDAYLEWNNKRFESLYSTNNTIKDEDLLDVLNQQYEATEDDVREEFVPYLYKGPWQFDYRGIDPSVLTLEAPSSQNLWEDKLNIPDMPSSEWASKDSDEPPLDNILFIDYKGEHFVVLEMYNTWKESCTRLDKKPKEYFVKAIALLATNKLITEEKETIKKYAEGRNNYDVYTVFSREFFWSDAYEDYEAQVEKEKYDDEDFIEPSFIETGIDYHCPMSYSETVDNIISSYSMPSKYLVENLGLKQLQDGKWFDKDGNLICLDVKFDNYQSALIIKRNSLFELINSKELCVAWGIFTEKKGDKHFYATRKIAILDGDVINIEEYESEQWTSKM